LLDSSQTEVKSSTARIYLNGFDLLLWHFNLNKGMGELYPDKGKEQSLLVAIQILLFQHGDIEHPMKVKLSMLQFLAVVCSVNSGALSLDFV
jgi:hypothetical protein